jgi:hypothetical protein
MLEFNKSQHLENEEMGEVRVKVKLTNSIDEELLLNPNQLRFYETEALVRFRLGVKLLVACFKITFV